MLLSEVVSARNSKLAQARDKNAVRLVRHTKHRSTISTNPMMLSLGQL